MFHDGYGYYLIVLSCLLTDRKNAHYKSPNGTKQSAKFRFFWGQLPQSDKQL